MYATVPYDPESEPYDREPTDKQCVVLARALAHYLIAYCEWADETTVRDLVLDLFRSNALDSMTLTERRAIEHAIRVPVRT